MTCDSCDRPKATEYHWSEEYSRRHGDGDGCECEECRAVCWGGCTFTDAAKEKRKARAAEAEAIVKSLALSNPDATEDGEIWCAVCNYQMHTGWPALFEHSEECAYRRAVEWCRNG